jgi:HEAT repeat protein
VNRLEPFFLAVLLVLTGSSLGAGESPTLLKTLDQLLPRLGSTNFVDRNDAEQKLRDVCLQLGAPGAEAQRAEVARWIASRLGPKTVKSARICLLNQLGFIGRGECVDAVAVLLQDEDADIRELARRTLEGNPAPEANARLLTALSGPGDARWRAAIIQSLGVRADQASVAALAKCLSDPDSTVAAAAAHALGTIGGDQAIQALKAAMPGATPEMLAQIAAARLCCADKLLDEGKTDSAVAVYRELAQPGNPKLTRRTAIQGMLNASGERAASMIVELLANDNPDTRAIAAGHISKVTGPEATKQFAEALAGLPPPGRVLLLEALAVRGDKSVIPMALAAAKDEDLETRLAGLRSLTKLADGSVVPMFIETMVAGGKTGDVARQCLVSASGDGVEQAIITAMKDADIPLRSKLIGILDQRRATAAVPSLLQEARHQNASIREPALRALGNLADPQDISALVRLLLDTEKSANREPIEKTITAVANRIVEKDQRALPLLQAFANAGDSERCALLPVLGRIGGAKALELIYASRQSENENVRDAAVRALCNWPDASVADQLLEIAENYDNKTCRTWALRAYVRVITQPSHRSAKETLTMLTKAMGMATQIEEKKFIVTRASAVRSIDTLRWILPYLDDGSLNQDACRAVVTLAHRKDLRATEPSRSEFLAALKKVTQVSNDPMLVDRATRYIQGL